MDTIYVASFLGYGVALKAPTADGAANTLLQTDGSGTLSFDSGMTWDGTSLIITRDYAGLTDLQIHNDDASGFSGCSFYDGSTLTAKVSFQNAGHFNVSTEIAGRDVNLRPNGTTALTATENSGVVRVELPGALQPATIADASAGNNSIYYSSTQSKLVYKDSGGTVRDLY